MLGPVFRHEMYAAGRKRRYLLLRVAIGALLLAMLAIAYETVRSQVSWYGEAEGEGLSIAATSRLAAGFYGSFAWFTLLGAIGVTPAIAAGAIASERERRTIEYLFTTDLSNAEIVVDKLAARLLTVVALALAALPLLAIFRLLGGVPAGLVLVHFAQLVTATAMVAGISLAISTWCDRARDAVPRAYLTVLLTLVAPGVLWLLNSRIRSPAPWLVDWVTGPLESAFRWINPIWTLGESGGVTGGLLGVDLDLPAVLFSMAAQLVVAAACLAACAAVVRRVHLAASGRGETLSKERAARNRPAPSESDPMLWKERHASRQLKRGGRSQAAAVTLIVVALGAASVWALWESAIDGSKNAWKDYFYYSATLVGFLGPIVALLAGSRAAGLVTYEKERETWLSLLTTPLSGVEIVRAKLLGNLSVFTWPVAGVVTIVTLGLYVNPRTGFAVVGVALAVGATTWAASAVGLWFSLRFQSSVKAIGATIATLVGLGGGYLPFVMTFAAMAGWDGDAMAICFAPCVPFLCVVPIVLQVDSGEPVLVAAYAFGLLGYSALAIGVTMSAISRFDELSERGAGEWDAPPATPAA